MSNGRNSHTAHNLLYQFGDVSIPIYHATRDANHNTDVSIVSVEATTFNVYPNPATNTVTFDYSLEEGEDAELVFIDLAGKVVAIHKLVYQHSQQVIYIASLPEGIYTLSIQSSEDILAHAKLVKM